MLIGGAFTDRFSPRSVMLASNLVRMSLVAGLAGLIFAGWIQVWMIFVFAFLFGLADAFFFPASSSIVPRLVRNEQLQTGNAAIQGTAQLSMFLGPVLAGVLIALLGGAGDEVTDMDGIGAAFGLDALTFAFSALTLALIHLRRRDPAEDEIGGSSVLRSIRQGLAAVWDDPTLRPLFIMLSLANMLVMGPVFVGIPVLADTRLDGGAAAFGIIMSAYGGGSLFGTVLGGVLPRPPARQFGVTLGVIWSLMGVSLAAAGLVTSTALVALAALVMGLSSGYVSILFITWLQRRTPDAMLGRMMSLVMVALIGLQPVSIAVAGAFVALNPAGVFVGFGLLMTTIVLLNMLNPHIRQMGLQTTAD
jgi:MFS family permease